MMAQIGVFFETLLYHLSRWFLRLNALWVGFVLVLDGVQHFSTNRTGLEPYPYTACYLAWPYSLVIHTTVNCSPSSGPPPRVFEDGIWVLLLFLIVLLVWFHELPELIWQIREKRIQQKQALILAAHQAEAIKEHARQEAARQAQLQRQRELALQNLLTEFRKATEWYSPKRPRPVRPADKVKPDGEL